jgi:hypothetical protein
MVAGTPVEESTICIPNIFLAGDVAWFNKNTDQMIQPIPKVTIMRTPSRRLAPRRAQFPTGTTVPERDDEPPDAGGGGGGQGAFDMK